MARSKIVIPILTKEDVLDFPSKTASSAEVFTWIKSRCSKKYLDSQYDLNLTISVGLDGQSLHAKCASNLMVNLRRMGFGGMKKGTTAKKAKQITGFILAARRLLVSYSLWFILSKVSGVQVN